MKPYGSKPGEFDTGDNRPRSGRTAFLGGDPMEEESASSIARQRRRLKKKARQKARQTIDEELFEDEIEAAQRALDLSNQNFEE